jgi:hypothetical protein
MVKVNVVFKDIATGAEESGIMIPFPIMVLVDTQRAHHGTFLDSPPIQVVDTFKVSAGAHCSPSEVSVLSCPNLDNQKQKDYLIREAKTLEEFRDTEFIEV